MNGETQELDKLQSQKIVDKPIHQNIMRASFVLLCTNDGSGQVKQYEARSIVCREKENEFNESYFFSSSKIHND